MYKVDAVTALDFYKTGHINQYPKGTEVVYSNWTARSGKYSNTNTDAVVFFGLQAFIKSFLIDCWNETFFNRDKEEVLNEYQELMDSCLGPNVVTVDHLADLHDYGRLPILIKALPEGSLVPYGVPMITIKNTVPRFFWLTNYLESVMSTELWRPTTSATTAYAYRKRFNEHAEITGSSRGFIPWQGHDFSFRGMGGISDAAVSGAGHLLSFTGTDTVPAIRFVKEYYNTDYRNELVGSSVPATEHSVMSMGSFDGEFETFKRLITETYPTGIISIVADTWDFWKVLMDYLPRLKDEIMARDGRVVIRPDSSPKTPVEIICGDPRGRTKIERIGAYRHLWDVFGGHTNDKGYKVLDSHIGLIYGDAITLDRQDEILALLEGPDIMMTAENLVLGIGSYTYVYCTRDTHGFAMKATWGKVNGVGTPIFKDPVTDPGFKKSAIGLLRVLGGPDGKLRLHDMVSEDEETTGLLRPVFEDGELLVDDTFTEIRERLGTF